MQRTNNETEQVTEAPELTRPPDFNRPLKPIGEVVAQPGFPEAVLGEHVDIGGYTGVVVAVVKQSIKVRSPEGVVRSFKSYTLQRLYGPRPEPVPSMEGAAELGDLEGDVPKAAPPREIIEEPNFEQPITAISELLTNPDFPKSAFGQ